MKVAFLIFVVSLGTLWAEVEQDAYDVFSLSITTKLAGTTAIDLLIDSIDDAQPEKLLPDETHPLLSWDKLSKRQKKALESIETTLASLQGTQRRSAIRKIREHLVEQLQFIRHLKENVAEEQLKSLTLMDRQELLTWIRKEWSMERIRRWVEVRAYLESNGDAALEKRGLEALRDGFHRSVTRAKEQLSYYPKEVQDRFLNDLHRHLIDIFDQLRAGETLEDLAEELEGEKRRVLRPLQGFGGWGFKGSLTQSAKDPIAEGLIRRFSAISKNEGFAKTGKGLYVAQQLLQLSPQQKKLIPTKLERYLIDGSSFLKLARSSVFQAYLDRLSRTERALLLAPVHDAIALSLLEKENKLQRWKALGQVSFIYDDNISRLPDGLTLVSGNDGMAFQLGASGTYQWNHRQNRQCLSHVHLIHHQYFDSQFSNR